VNCKLQSAFHDFERAGWQRAAEFYAETFGKLTVQTIEALRDAARVGSSVRVLDVATGPGYVAGAAAARGAIVTGIDFSSSMIAEAQRRYPTVTFREGDAEALSFEDGAFNAVVMNFGLLHLARPEDAMAEARRVVSAGGRFAFTVWGKPEEACGFGVVLRAMEAHGTLDVGLPEGPPFFRFSDPDECRRTMTQAGFAHTAVRHLPLVWRLPSADALFEAALRGGVRTSAALQAQTPEALAKIRQAVNEALAANVDGDGVVVPMTVVLAWGTRP
jgi:SAM-dependent methyltransferase